MTRKALIIGAAYKDPKIPGVYTDLVFWNEFLQSDLGGSWTSEEVKVLPDPTAAEVHAALKTMGQADYGFLVFCGHGATVTRDKPWPETELYFGKHGQLTDSEINPGNPRCTLVLDCCRGYLDAEDDRQFLVEGKSASFSVRKNVREIFDKSLEVAEMGLVTIFAAREGQDASDRKSFSKQLIHQARITMERHTGVLDQALAVELTAEAMKKTTPQQQPEYIGGRRRNHFPFAVDA
jgi:hypothetical protein